jgi:ankyrin repeat protein
MDDFEEFSRVIMTDSNCDQITSLDFEKMTPLHHAIFHQREKFAMTLIKVGPLHARDFKSNINSKDVREMTPLHLAALKSNLIIITSLLNAGADPHITNINGETPLDLAKRAKRKIIVEELEYYMD